MGIEPTRQLVTGTLVLKTIMATDVKDIPSTVYSIIINFPSFDYV